MKQKGRHHYMLTDNNDTGQAMDRKLLKNGWIRPGRYKLEFAESNGSEKNPQKHRPQRNMLRTFVVNLRSICTSQHLKHVWDGIVLVGVYLAIVVLCVHDDDEVCREAETPSEAPRHDDYLDVTASKQVLDETTFQFRETLVEVRDTVAHSLAQSLVTRHKKQCFRCNQLLWSANLLRSFIYHNNYDNCQHATDTCPTVTSLHDYFTNIHTEQSHAIYTHI